MPIPHVIPVSRKTIGIIFVMQALINAMCYHLAGRAKVNSCMKSIHCKMYIYSGSFNISYRIICKLDIDTELRDTSVI